MANNSNKKNNRNNNMAETVLGNALGNYSYNAYNTNNHRHSQKGKNSGPSKVDIYYAKKKGMGEHPTLMSPGNKALWWFAHYGHKDKGKLESMNRATFNRRWAKVATNSVNSNQDLDVLWEKYNIGNSSIKTPAGQEKLRSVGVGHSSMSILDVVKTRTGYWMATSRGWRRINVLD